MESSLTEMKTELKRLKKEVALERNLGLCRNGLLFCINIIEYLNGKWDPLDLRMQGWSAEMVKELDSYDDVFEELLEKYGGSIDAGPEIRLLSMIGISAFGFYAQKTLVEKLTGVSTRGGNGNNTSSGGILNLVAKMMGFQNMAANNRAKNRQQHEQETQQSQQQQGNQGGSGSGGNGNNGGSQRTPMRGPSTSFEDLMASMERGHTRHMDHPYDSDEDNNDDDESVMTVPVSAPPKKRRGRPPKNRSGM